MKKETGNDKYKVIYDKIMDYERQAHEENQKRIRAGLKCIVIVPLIFLCLLFWTDSSKLVFLILWILSLFLIAVYLIYVEYMDYNLLERVKRLDEEEKDSRMEDYALIDGKELLGSRMKMAIEKIEEEEPEEKKEAENEEHN